MCADQLQGDKDENLTVFDHRVLVRDDVQLMPYDHIFYLCHNNTLQPVAADGVVRCS